jgi:hypothetical protein
MISIEKLVNLNKRVTGIEPCKPSVVGVLYDTVVLSAGAVAFSRLLSTSPTTLSGPQKSKNCVELEYLFLQTNAKTVST